MHQQTMTYHLLFSPTNVFRGHWTSASKQSQCNSDLIYIESLHGRAVALYTV